MVGNGREGLEFFKSGISEGAPYDLVLLDIMMPGMDGHDVLKEMRKFEQEQEIQGQNEVVIFMVTAMDSPRSVLKSFFKGGCTDFIAKPVTEDILLEKMRENKLI